MMTVAFGLFLLLVTVIVHEAGHAIAMTRRGIEIEELGIGFSLSGKYRVSFRLPFLSFPIVITPFLLGAYVRPTEAGAEKLYNMSYKDQAACYSAGVIMNILYAAVAVLIAGVATSVTEYNRLPNLKPFVIFVGFIACVVIFRRSLSMVTPVFGFVFLCFWARLVLGPGSDTGADDPATFAGLALIGGNWIEAIAFSAVPSLLIAFFNMIPFIPLDGGHVLGAFFRTHGWKRAPFVYNMMTGALFFGYMIGVRIGGLF